MTRERRARLMPSRSASVRMLPNEVLSYIFELGVLGQGRRQSPWKYQYSGARDFEILVSQVSRHFRDVAVSTPALWSVIHVKGPKESQIDYVKTYLERSRSLPLTITLDYIGDEIDPEDSEPVVDRVMTFVKVNTYRLEWFIAKLQHLSMLRQMIEYMDQPAPQLTTLEFFGYASSSFAFFDLDTTRPPQFSLFDGQMPKLTRVVLEGLYGFQWLHHDLKNLTELDISYEDKPTYHEFRSIIDNSPSLRRLSLQGPLPSSLPSLAEAGSVIVLESLEYLEIRYLSPDIAIAVVSLIRAPNLKSLYLGEMLAKDYSRLLDQIAGPPSLFPDLISLSIMSVEVSEAAFTKLLRENPQLESLGLSCIGGFEDRLPLVDILEGTTNPGDPCLCPNLKYLRCADITVEAIQDILKKRSEANIPPS